MISILPSEMRGVMFITGYRGIGKSFLAAQADAPENIAFFDFESKGAGIHSQLGFGLYRALTQEATRGPGQLYDVAMSTLDSLEQDKYTVAVLDNVSPLELALQAGARRNARQYAEEYGLNLKNMLAGRFGGFKPVVNHLISSRVCTTLHSKGIQLIVAISHISARWSTAGPIPNKYRMKGADRWQELSILTLALIPGEHAPIPAALVRKEQLGLIAWDGEEHTTSSRLPIRIPKCTFAEIRRYLQEPASLNNPAQGEVPTIAERDPFDEQLNKEQITIMRLALEKERRETIGIESVVTADTELAERAKALKAQDESLPEIAEQLGIPVPEVAKLLK